MFKALHPHAGDREGRGEEEEGGRRLFSPGFARLDGVLRGGQRHLVHDEHHHLGLLVGGQRAGEGPCGDKNALAVCEEQPSTPRSTRCLVVCLSAPLQASCQTFIARLG